MFLTRGILPLGKKMSTDGGKKICLFLTQKKYSLSRRGDTSSSHNFYNLVFPNRAMFCLMASILTGECKQMGDTLKN